MKLKLNKLSDDNIIHLRSLLAGLVKCKEWWNTWT